MDHAFASSQPPEPEKAPPPSTTLDLQNGVAQTFIVDLASLGGRALGDSEKEDRKSTPTGEHLIDGSQSPSSPRERLEKIPQPPLSVDVPAACPSPSTDTESVGTPIQPPGLPLPIDTAPVEANETALPVPPKEDGEAERATPASFSLSGLEPLRTLIPEDLLPHDLLVYDPDNISHLEHDKRYSQSDKPVRYVRVFPPPTASQSQEPASTSTDGSPEGGSGRPVRVARLYLKKKNMLGGGHHSSVYSAPLRLRLSAESEEESTVRVGVKTALARCGAHEMLRREAVAYNAFPRHLMEDRCPVVESPPPPAASAKADSAQPEGVAHVETADTNGAAPASTTSDVSESTDEGDKCHAHTPPPEPAVVPKFFGYYAAVDADGSVIERTHRNCDKDDTCSVSWPTRLLLVEECGEPVVFRRLTYKHRIACFELLKRLHAAGFTQGSVYERNILVQPGPLSAPPEERSDRTPSFRIIDFGRMKMRKEIIWWTRSSDGDDVRDSCDGCAGVALGHSSDVVFVLVARLYFRWRMYMYR